MTHTNNQHVSPTATPSHANFQAREEHNPELELAWEFVEHTGVSLFLTGKAGTGKTTFLRTLRRESSKTMVVVAPTGIAAINAEGVTIHSFFQLPLAPYVPGATVKEKFGFAKEKLRIIRALDLLVIDEISMVRSDLLDAVDNALRKYRRSPLPFGGVQLLMIGDLQQLAPVVTPRDEALMAPYYSSAYFFGSHALAQIPYMTIELQKVYRQQNPTFIELLNHVRENRMTATDVALLNSRLNPSFRPARNSDFIRLTTHNHMADSYNAAELARLTSPMYTYDAKVSGTFPESNYPLPLTLQLKVGAQVMFVKNDTSGNRRYFNGKIGHVVYADRTAVRVQCPGEEHPIEVTPEVWENARYTVNESTNTIDTEVMGTFTQLPLRLAWAITIHKSQGLTFDHVIIDAGASFAPGQVYVALSRCKTLEGIVLATPIGAGTIETDPKVEAYISHQEEAARQSVAQLPHIKQEYHRHLLMDLFRFASIASLQESLLRQLNSVFSHSFPAETAEQQQIALSLREKVTDVADKWIALIASMTYESLSAPTFLERVSASARYFSKELQRIFANSLRNAAKVRTENKKASQRVKELVADLRQQVDASVMLLELIAENGFDAPHYLKFKQKATLDATREGSLKRVAKGGRFLSETDPDTATVGSSRTSRSRRKSAAAEPKEKKKPSHEITYELFGAGMTREEIATERSLTVTTITNHLMHYVDRGTLSIDDVLTPTLVNAITSAIRALAPDATASEIQALLPPGTTIADIIIVRSLLRNSEA